MDPPHKNLTKIPNMETMTLLSFSLWYVPLLVVPLYILTTQLLGKILNLPPSPSLRLPILGHLHLLLKNKPLHRSLADASHRHGHVLLLHLGSRRVLLVSSPSAAEECLTRNDVVFANRPRLLAAKHLGYGYTSLAWSSYGDHWRNLRKISSIEVLSAHRLQTLHWIRAHEVRSMVRRLIRRSGEAVDLKRAFFETVMNVMMRMIAGKRYYGEGAAEEVEEASRFREMVTDTFRYGGSSNLLDFVPALKWVGARGLERRLEELQRRRDSFMQDLVEGCKQRMRRNNGYGGGKKETMMEMLLELQEKEPDYYTDTMIKSLMLVLLSAGTDTSAVTMEWALSLLLNNPHVLKKAQIEIDNHVGHDRLMEESDIANLPYLRSIIHETMRMYPAGPLLVPHESSDQCTVGGYRVPANTMLLVNLWAIQNDPKNWEEPRKFKPERFEGVEGNRDGFRLMPFGSGRRGCPGEGLALRMVGLGLGSVIQCFEWERIGEDLVDMSEGRGLTLPKAQPLVAYCKARPFVGELLSQVD